MGLSSEYKTGGYVPQYADKTDALNGGEYVMDPMLGYNSAPHELHGDSLGRHELEGEGRRVAELEGRPERGYGI